MARISLTPPPSLTFAFAKWYARRRFGMVMEPSRAMAHQPQVLRTMAGLELSAQRWRTVSPGLTTLAVMAAAATVECAWCMDFGYWHGLDSGLEPAKVRDLPRWRSSPVYTDLERAVIGYAEAVSHTPPTVSDEQVARLRQDLNEGQLVELTMMIAIENERARFNTALGLASQGFADRCALRPVPADGSAA